MNCTIVREVLIVGDKDQEALSFLRDISCKLLEDARSFQFDFEFGENPFFENTLLTKKYMIDEDGDPVGAEGCDIEWKSGKNLTVKLKKKKRGGKNRPAITKTEPCDTFFKWFSPPQIPGSDDEDELDEAQQEELEELLEEDFDLGMTFKDKIIPHAVMWFTGEAQDSDEESSDEEDEEGSDDDSDDDDDDNEQAAPAPRRRGGLKQGGGDKNSGDTGGAAQAFGAPGAANGQENPECKQQ